MEIDKVFNNDVDGVADNLFSAVKNSVSEIKAMQQRKAAENVQLVIRALKKLETELRETNEDVANQLALRIASIKDGRDGKDGKNGKDGRDGKAGRDGKDGNKGDKGADGRDGVDGVDGVSVVNANIDFDGSLIISLSDGREINVGEVVAPDLAERIKVISTMSTNGAVGIKDEGTSISTGVKNINFVGAAVTATNSGDDVTVNVSAGTGTVTSVAATVPTFLSVTGSPVTTSGTLAIGLSGTALPVANGGTGVTTSTGTTNVVLSNSPTLVTPVLGAASATSVTVAAGAVGTPSITTTGDTNTGIFFPAADTIAFAEGGVEAMRIDSGGSVRINNTSNATFSAQLNTQFASAFQCGQYLKVTDTSASQSMMIFGNTNNDAVGSIGTNGSSTSYNTSSDYRLKQDIVPMTGALAKVALLKPVNYKWKFDGSEGEGFIAHELAEVCPNAVTGEKDAVNSEGNPIHQGIDTSFLVATLTSAIQEQQALITSLTARIEVLEAK